MVQIGSKYTGKPAHHTDTQAGTYWEVLPTIEGQALALQRALLKRAAVTVRRFIGGRK
jgi:hypothetical protein